MSECISIFTIYERILLHDPILSDATIQTIYIV